VSGRNNSSIQNSLRQSLQSTRENERLCIQVAYLLAQRETVEREIGPLMALKDNYPKYLITLDRHFGDDIEGIHLLHLRDFLLRRK